MKEHHKEAAETTTTTMKQQRTRMKKNCLNYLSYKWKVDVIVVVNQVTDHLTASRKKRLQDNNGKLTNHNLTQESHLVQPNNQSHKMETKVQHRPLTELRTMDTLDGQECICT